MFFSLGNLGLNDVDDPRYTAASFLADTTAGYGVDIFYTGGPHTQFSTDAHTPIGVDLSPFQITNGAPFNPIAAFVTSPNASQRITPTQPTRNLTTQSGVTTDNNTTPTTLLGIGKEQLIKGALVFAVGLVAVKVLK